MMWRAPTRTLQNYTPWVEYETKVMRTVEEAVPIILESLADLRALTETSEKESNDESR